MDVTVLRLRFHGSERNEDILRDLRDFLFEPIPQLNLLDELDKRGIAFVMPPLAYGLVSTGMRMSVKRTM